MPICRLNTIVVLLLCLFVSSALHAGKFLKEVKKDSGPIDIVYTWVDDQDPVWQTAKQNILASYSVAATPDAKSKTRFRNRDELKYSLRSVLANASFVNHIYIVTFGHKPSWLKEHPKITVVDHKKIFKNPAYLPTFNSQAIEANLHRIPNLKERFIYFNDDVFLGRKLGERDFFSQHGKIKLFCVGGNTPRGVVQPQDIAHTASWKNTNQFLDTHFGVQPRQYLGHAPFALRKSLMKKFEELFPQLMDKVSSHRFRSPEDHVVTCGLIQYFALYEHHGRKEKINSKTIGFTNDVERNRERLRELYNKRPDAFCIEDISDADSPGATFQLKQFLETYFPEKAPWEN
jgi:hypothetical protein